VQTKPSHTARATKIRIQVPQDSKTKGHGEMEPREIYRGTSTLQSPDSAPAG